MRQEVLRVQRVTCTAQESIVLDNFNLHIFAGEIMGLIFVDSCGKQELVELICKNQPLHYGRVYYRDKLVNSYLHSPLTDNPVTLVEKHSHLVDDMSVADNVFVLRKGFKKYYMRPKMLAQQFESFAAEAGVDIKGNGLVCNLTPYEKCVVQLLKGIILGHRLILIQDISNAISSAELVRFQNLLRHYASKGFAFLYMCSHHEEAFSICDRAAVVENGQVQRNVDRPDFLNDIFHDYLLDAGLFGSGVKVPHGENTALTFQQVCTQGLHNANFSIEKGECVVLLDASNTALGDIFELLSGRQKLQSGKIWLDGAAYPSAKHRKEHAIGLIQESPVTSTLLPDFSYLDNLCFLAGEKQSNMWRRPRMRKSIRKEYLPYIGPDIDATDIHMLSPTSLYNLVYYRQHLYNPKLLVIMQPFFGADMYLRRHILALIDTIRKKGIAVLMLAINISDSPVVADRLLVLQNGGITTEYSSKDMERLNRQKNL